MHESFHQWQNRERVFADLSSVQNRIASTNQRSSRWLMGALYTVLTLYRTFFNVRNRKLSTADEWRGHHRLLFVLAPCSICESSITALEQVTTGPMYHSIGSFFFARRANTMMQRQPWKSCWAFFFLTLHSPPPPWQLHYGVGVVESIYMTILCGDKQKKKGGGNNLLRGGGGGEGCSISPLGSTNGLSPLQRTRKWGSSAPPQGTTA